jgi:ADP-ribose pyrophosphatase
MPQHQLRILAEGKFTRLVAANHWEWVERINTTGAVVIVPITADRRIVLIEQYRIPLRSRVLELPAGLVGDVPGAADEPLLEAARRELLEETGYEAAHWQRLIEGPSSAGLTTEMYHLFLAGDARKVGAGGGDAQEQIDVVIAPLDGIDAWLEEKRRTGIVIDPKIYMGLYFAGRR